jgi:hypothetical protein
MTTGGTRFIASWAAKFLPQRWAIGQFIIHRSPLVMLQSRLVYINVHQLRDVHRPPPVGMFQ